MQPKESQIIDILTSPTSKFLVTVFLAGYAWSRFENKVDEKFGEIITTIKIHVAEDYKDKQRIEERLSELQAKVDKMEQQAEDFVRNEYIRPSEPKPETERRRR